MKTLIVYYSMGGNTEYVAEKLKANIEDAETLRLVPQKAYKDKGFAKFVWGGKSAIMAEKPELEEYKVDLSQYDRIIFGFPVWAGTFTPPIRTFIADNKASLEGKRFCAYACMAGKGGVKAIEKLAKALKIKGFEATSIFIDPKDSPSAEKEAQINGLIVALNQ
ncbi:MAG: NAD(P)H-dependent oxidoreductase [Butyrivibrio sp.]|nr:NAD(P)H-dependent oxidoreductase [Butyrivibrio sp.]